MFGCSTRRLSADSEGSAAVLQRSGVAFAQLSTANHRLGLILARIALTQSGCGEQKAAFLKDQLQFLGSIVPSRVLPLRLAQIAMGDLVVSAPLLHFDDSFRRLVLDSSHASSTSAASLFAQLQSLWLLPNRILASTTALLSHGKCAGWPVNPRLIRLLLESSPEASSKTGPHKPRREHISARASLVAVLLSYIFNQGREEETFADSLKACEAESSKRASVAAVLLDWLASDDLHRQRTLATAASVWAAHAARRTVPLVGEANATIRRLAHELLQRVRDTPPLMVPILAAWCHSPAPLPAVDAPRAAKRRRPCSGYDAGVDAIPPLVPEGATKRARTERGDAAVCEGLVSAAFGVCLPLLFSFLVGPSLPAAKHTLRTATQQAEALQALAAYTQPLVPLAAVCTSFLAAVDSWTGWRAVADAAARITLEPDRVAVQPRPSGTTAFIKHLPRQLFVCHLRTFRNAEMQRRKHLALKYQRLGGARGSGIRRGAVVLRRR